MKQILQKLLIVMSILVTIESASAYDFEVDGIYYSVISLEDMTCEVVNGDVKYEGSIIIPAEIIYNTRTLSVTAIGSEAFCKCRSLISVNIPNSVTSIGNNAFEECSSLESINIPNSVTFIGYSAFYNCSSLLSIIISDSVTSILSSTFYGCSSLESIVIPNSVTSIGPSAFWDCSSLESIVIPNSVTSIGQFAFEYCSSLESIVIPNSVTSIGPSAFRGCSSLDSIVIPNSVTSIGYSTFEGCSSLESIVIPNSVTSIEYSAFKGCSSLESVALSDTLESISYGLFSNCYSLKALDVPGSVQKIAQRYDDSTGWSKSIYTFEECLNLSKLSLQYSVDPLIVGYTEKYASGFGSDIRFCESYWYSSWTKTIKELYIDRSLEEDIIVKNLEELEIGEHMEEVRVGYISEMENLSIIKSYALIPPELPEMTNIQYMNINVYVPEESLDTYKADPVWGKFWNLSDVKSIGADIERTIMGCYDLSGKIVDEDYKGLVIVHFSDGSVKKIFQ